MSLFNEITQSIPDFPDALCAKTGNPDFWFPENGTEMKQRIDTLKRICGACIHQADCAKFAIEEAIEDGIWGGMTPRERTALRGKGERKRRISNAGERIAVMKENGMTYRQIADIMDMTPNAAQAALLRHRKRQEASA